MTVGGIILCVVAGLMGLLMVALFLYGLLEYEYGTESYTNEDDVPDGMC